MNNLSNHIKNKLAWIAVDWGTTNLRLWAMDKNGRVIEKKSSKEEFISFLPNF